MSPYFLRIMIIIMKLIIIIIIIKKTYFRILSTTVLNRALKVDKWYFPTDYCSNVCVGFMAQSAQWGHVARLSLPNHIFTRQT